MRWLGLVLQSLVMLVWALFPLAGDVGSVFDLPAAYDLREQAYPFPVIEQHNCQMGYAAAGTEAFSAALWQESLVNTPFSVNNAKECNWEELNLAESSCLNGEIEDVINLFAIKGAVNANCDPLVTGDVDCNTSCAPLYQLSGWQRLSTNTIAAPTVIKQALLDHGPVYTKLDKSMDGFADYGGGVLYDPAASPNPDHAVLIVGWDDTVSHAGGSGVWIVKNSYGSDWGVDGYAQIAYGSGGIGQFSSVVTAWQENDPQGYLHYHDAAGAKQKTAIVDQTGNSAYMMVLFTTERAELIQQVELWTMDAAEVRIWIYDRFTNGTLADLLYQSDPISVPRAGYYVIPVDAHVELDLYDEVAVVAKIENENHIFALAADMQSPLAVGKNWYSKDGVNWTAAVEDGFEANMGLRLRTTIPDPPGQPQITSILAVSSSSVGLNWTLAEANFHGYLLERRHPVSGIWERIADLAPDIQKSYLDEGLAPATEYCYRLYAYNLGGLSTPATACVSTLPLPPDAPADLDYEILLPNTVRLNWQDNSDNEEEFWLERYHFDGILSETWVLDANMEGFTDSGLSAEEKYYYQLFARNAGGSSSAIQSEWITMPAWPYTLHLPMISR